MKTLLILFMTALLLADVSAARAHERYAYNAPIQMGDTNITTNKSSGAALGIAAAQHQFDWGTNDFQAGVAGGYFQGNAAISIGIGRRFKNVLINGSFGSELGNAGYGIGVMSRF